MAGGEQKKWLSSSYSQMLRIALREVIVKKTKGVHIGPTWGAQIGQRWSQKGGANRTRWDIHIYIYIYKRQVSHAESSIAPFQPEAPRSSQQECSATAVIVTIHAISCTDPREHGSKRSSPWCFAAALATCFPTRT